MNVLIPILFPWYMMLPWPCSLRFEGIPIDQSFKKPWAENEKNKKQECRTKIKGEINSRGSEKSKNNKERVKSEISKEKNKNKLRKREVI